MADLEGEARRLFAFLALPFEPDLLDYRATAGRRAIVTPSYHQVTQPLYRHAEGRWRRFVDELAPVMARLSPWVEAYGYETAPLDKGES